MQPNAGSTDLAALAQRALQGIEAAAAEQELCARIAPRVRALARARLRDAASADDVTQDVLMIVLDALRRGTLREPERVLSFVLATCRRIADERVRTRRRRDALLDRHVASQTPVEPEVESAHTDSEAVARCLETLPARERLVLYFTFFADRDAADVATRIDTTPGNVRVIRHRALRRVRPCLSALEDA